MYVCRLTRCDSNISCLVILWVVRDEREKTQGKRKRERERGKEKERGRGGREEPGSIIQRLTVGTDITFCFRLGGKFSPGALGT